MSRDVMSAVILIALGYTFLPTGTALGDGNDRAEPVLVEGTEPTVLVMLELVKPRYQFGEPILMQLTVRNEHPHEPVVLQFPSAQRYDVIVTKGKEEIWRWSTDKLFATMLGEEVLKPRDALRYTATWDQRDSAGAPIVPDSYEVVGIITTSPEMSAEPVIVAIQAERDVLVE